MMDWYWWLVIAIVITYFAIGVSLYETYVSVVWIPLLIANAPEECCKNSFKLAVWMQRRQRAAFIYIAAPTWPLWARRIEAKIAAKEGAKENDPAAPLPSLFDEFFARRKS